MKNNQNKLCYFITFFPPKFLHFCRMTRTRKNWDESTICFKGDRNPNDKYDL